MQETEYVGDDIDLSCALTCVRKLRGCERERPQSNPIKAPTFVCPPSTHHPPPPSKSADRTYKNMFGLQLCQAPSVPVRVRFWKRVMYFGHAVAFADGAGDADDAAGTASAVEEEEEEAAACAGELDATPRPLPRSWSRWERRGMVVMATSVSLSVGPRSQISSTGTFTLIGKHSRSCSTFGLQDGTMIGCWSPTCPATRTDTSACVEPKPLLAKAAHQFLRSKTSLVAT